MKITITNSIKYSIIITAAIATASIYVPPALAQSSNEADSTNIFVGAGRTDPNWQGAGYYSQPSNPPSVPPVYELPAGNEPQEPEDPGQGLDCSVENGCMTPEQACSLGGTMYCSPEEPTGKPMHCGLDNGCVDQAGEDAMLCASGFPEYCH